MAAVRIALLHALLAVSSLAAPLQAAAEAAGSPGLQTVRPPGYKPIAGDARLGEKLFNDTGLSTNGMSCSACHANHGAFQASFAQPYPHTVQMAAEQLGRGKVHLDEMVQACMVMPMEAKPLPWASKELAALVAYLRLQQKTFKPSTTP
jgi:cytochrome c